MGFKVSRNSDVPFLGGPCNKDYSVWGSILGSPIEGNYQSYLVSEPLVLDSALGSYNQFPKP